MSRVWGLAPLVQVGDYQNGQSQAAGIRDFIDRMGSIDFGGGVSGIPTLSTFAEDSIELGDDLNRLAMHWKAMVHRTFS